MSFCGDDISLKLIKYLNQIKEISGMSFSPLKEQNIKEIRFSSLMTDETIYFFVNIEKVRNPIIIFDIFYFWF